MYRKVAASGLQHAPVAPGVPADRLRRRHAEAPRWPRGVSLSIALMVSLAMWAGLIFGGLALVGR